MWRPRSLRLRYTLRALLVFITLFMLWGGYHTNRSWKQRLAENVLRGRGATCDYATFPIEGDLAKKIYAIYMRIVQEVWQERAVSYVSLSAPPDPEVVNALAALPHLRLLTWEPARATPKQVLRMQQGKELEPTHTLPAGALKRIFSNCPIQAVTIGLWQLSDEDCRAIASQPGMQSVVIDGCNLSEAGFADLIMTSEIVSFSFRYCDVTGSAIPNGAHSPTLQRIVGGAAPLDKALAEFVARSPNVTELMVDCQDGDEFLRALGPHSSLTLLAVGRRVTDDCVEDLIKMPALSIVGLPRPQVSEQGVAKLQAARPQLRIGHN